MARIVEIEQKDPTRKSIHKEAAATYSVFEVDNEVYFQIDTYGSKDRQFTGKCSQSIQLDRSAAELFVRLLKKEFSI